MKFNTALITLCAVAGADAFFVNSPSSLSKPVVPLHSYSYLGSLDAFSDANGSTETARVMDKTSAIGQTPAAPLDYAGGPQSGNMQRASAKTPATAPKAVEGLKSGHEIDSLNPVTVQGDSLRTWSFKTAAVERVQVLMKTEGRPLNANVELWQGPDNTPEKLSVYIEDGCLRPFNAVIETPRGASAIAIRNTGHLEFPLTACVEAELEGGKSRAISSTTKKLSDLGAKKVIQGGAIHTYPFAPKVASVQILLKTDGRPLNARVELMQGPNNNKQVLEIYTEDGNTRPFFAVIETPGSGNVVRVINTGTVEFPMTASVEPYMIDSTVEEPSMGGGIFQIS